MQLHVTKESGRFGPNSNFSETVYSKVLKQEKVGIDDFVNSRADPNIDRLFQARQIYRPTITI